MKLGLCLAGGGIKGIAHIGAIKALEEENIKFNYISGTSSGSIVATLYAVGYTTNEIYNIFEKYANDIKYFDIINLKKIVKNIFLGKGISIDGLNSGQKINKLVTEFCSKKKIKNINQVEMPLLIPAVNIHNEELIVFSNNIISNKSDDIKYVNDVEIGTAVQASCSYPGVFSPTEYRNMLLVDGGIAENLPWRETKRAGAEKVLSIVFVDEKEKSCCKNVLEVLNKSFSILCHELSKYEWDGTDYLLKIKMSNTGLLKSKNIKLLYEAGYNQTKKEIQKIRRNLYN